jgi:hypothetical protein
MEVDEASSQELSATDDLEIEQLALTGLAMAMIDTHPDKAALFARLQENVRQILPRGHRLEPRLKQAAMLYETCIRVSLVHRTDAGASRSAAVPEPMSDVQLTSGPEAFETLMAIALLAVFESCPDKARLRECFDRLLTATLWATHDAVVQQSLAQDADPFYRALEA